MVVKKDLRLRKVDGKNFIVAVGEESKTFSSMVKLNDTAAYVFQLIQKNASVGEIAQKLEKEYGISSKQAVSDVEAVIGAFKKAGFFYDTR